MLEEPRSKHRRHQGRLHERRLVLQWRSRMALRRTADRNRRPSGRQPAAPRVRAVPRNGGHRPHPHAGEVAPDQRHRRASTSSTASCSARRSTTPSTSLQTDLDARLDHYNNQREHQHRWCYGKTPMRTFLDSLNLAKENSSPTTDHTSSNSTMCQIMSRPIQLRCAIVLVAAGAGKYNVLHCRPATFPKHSHAQVLFVPSS